MSSGPIRFTISLPREPPATLTTPQAPNLDAAGFEKIVEDLFDFFGVDRRLPDADELMWLRLAPVVFPALSQVASSDTPKPPKGAPRKEKSKNNSADCKMLMEAYTAFCTSAAGEKRKLSPHLLYKRFQKERPDLSHLITKRSRGHLEFVSLAVFQRKLNIGRQQNALDRPPGWKKLHPAVRAAWEALNFTRGMSALSIPDSPTLYPIFWVAQLRRDLLGIKLETPEGKAAFKKILADVRHLVPSEISMYGLIHRPLRDLEKYDE